MNFNLKLSVISLTIFTASFSIFTSSISSTKAEVPANLKSIAIEKIAKSQGILGSYLKVINSTEVNYPQQNQKAAQFKVMDERSGKIYTISLSDRGQELNSVNLDNQELSLETAKNGKLSPQLKQKLTNAAAQEAMEVAIWLKDPTANAPGRATISNSGSPVSPATANSFIKKADEERTAAIKAVLDLADRKLQALGLKFKAEVNSPVIYSSLTPEQLQQVANLPEVDRVYENKKFEPTLDIARATILANVAESQGFTGTGIKVAEIEVGGRINTADPYLAGVVQDTTYSCAAWHADAVAGVIRSTHSTVRGVAPGVSLWVGGSCSGSGNELTDRSNAAVTWGAQVFNLSLGADSGRTVDGFARFYDDLTVNRRRTVVVSAGNSGNGGNVGTPALAYNVIAVGSFDDRNTSSWADELVSSFSSAIDPISAFGDREKPEVSAPGSNIITTNNVSPWINIQASGTSFSAPMVTGVVAQMMQANAGLSAAPEAVKSILMTAAIHNIEGDARLSEIDGAGGVTSDRAVNIARNIGGRWGSQSYSCSAAAATDVATLNLASGVRTRATIVWSNNPSYTSYSTKPSADLDLQIISPTGAVVTSSASWDNTYEIVDFTPASAGTYKLRVNKTRCDLTPKYLGWSWRQGS